MASTASLVHPHQLVRNSLTSSTTTTPPPRATAHIPSATRRGCLIFTATTVLTAVDLPSANAKDIPLFGLRKKLEQAEEIVKEGFETVEKGIDTVESGIESAEKGVVAAEKGIESAAESVSFSGLAQAGVVAGAEFLGVLIATSIVNSILGSQPQKT
ncbi:uncharacterized protein LOC110697747 [Chenopodium quinoa]|uniref:uncharacterized protein LOC110697747 n=1 Tax=Chenopodium quinoa TaxID=63459 RepID=UPI000B78E535|nr:uncharacterized protein LOC110697747 [Chenopodium quinoa]